ncbi:MAG TPA: cysteine desulfurase NifS, partial [Clostridiales bacterium UBA8960]|nr:cysteine desulfurase NifS [Clostridiales bacterium UBA8960]
MEIYLDHASTTPLSEDVKKIIIENLNTFGNPSSLHRLGVISEKNIKSSRAIICDALKIKEKELLFTSGGTEANNLAILGTASKRLGRFITSRIEHPSVLNAFETLAKAGHEVIYLDVDEWGIVDVKCLKEALTLDTQLVSIMFVNNETGSIQPIAEIGGIIKDYNCDHQARIKFHVDAVQAFGKMPIGLDYLQIDLMSISAHKINALKGTGALYVRESGTLKPLQYGGQQEQGLRPGTENLMGIIAFGEAVKHAVANMSRHYEHVAK